MISVVGVTGLKESRTPYEGPGPGPTCRREKVKSIYVHGHAGV